MPQHHDATHLRTAPALAARASLCRKSAGPSLPVPINFYLYVASRFAAGTALTLSRAAIAWHVFELTHDPFYLGLIGLVQFLPSLGLSLVGGAVADSFDRRRIINASQLVFFGSGLVLMYASQAGRAGLLRLFVAAACIAVAGAFEAPARAAMLPALVPREKFRRAVAISSTAMALAFATGPALAGSLIHARGIGAAYVAYLGLIATAFVGIATLRLEAPLERARVSINAIVEGITFVWKQPVILGCMSLDMFAVVFGGATALLPFYATEILHAGSRGYGWLTASFELGALAMSILLMLRPPARHGGSVLLSAVAVYGLATIAFGLSRHLGLSIGFYALAGMCDQISVVTRSTAIQLSTPDALRGRVSAVNMLFIGASNQLGTAESGFLAKLTSPTFSVVSGGVACLIVVTIIAWRIPALRRYHIGDQSS